MKVLQAIQRGTEFLESKGVDSPRLQAELLVADVLGLPRLELYLRFDQELTDAQVARARQHLSRRGHREPLQYIVGTTGFCGFEFQVGPQALVPRPETELLAERAWTWLHERREGKGRVLDFGTGSGCLAITVALKCPEALCHAVEISAEAEALARENARRHGVERRVEFHGGDGFGALPEGLRFDLVLANPPYIPTAELASLAPEVRDFEPRLALDGGPDGLRYFRVLAADAAKWLQPGGRLWAEFGDGQSEAIAGLLRSHNWVVEALDPDYSGTPRLVRARAGDGAGARPAADSEIHG